MATAGIRPIDGEKAASTTSNPALGPEAKLAVEKSTRTRVPMSSPKAKLNTPEIAGFHLHWLNDDGGRIQQAINGGYAFVDPSETLITSTNLTEEPVGRGTDMGTRVSVVVGKSDSGQPLRAYLMKIPNELYEEDQAAIQERVDNLHQAMNQGKQDIDGVQESAKDKALRYASRQSRKSTYSRAARA